MGDQRALLMQKAEQQDIAQPLESLNNPMEFPWVPSWLMVSNINQNQGEFLTGKLFFSRGFSFHIQTG